MQIFFDYAPELAQQVIPEKRFDPVIGPLLPLQIIVTAPSLYGYIGCSCLPGYTGAVTYDSSGEACHKN